MTTTIIRQIPTKRDWEELIERSSEPGRRQRGIRYVEEGHVLYVQMLHHEAQAFVQGKEPKPYSVSISLPNGLTAPNDVELDADCTCQDPEWICKHVVALMTVLGQKAAKQNPDDQTQTTQTTQTSTWTWTTTKNSTTTRPHPSGSSRNYRKAKPTSGHKDQPPPSSKPQPASTCWTNWETCPNGVAESGSAHSCAPYTATPAKPH